MLRERRPALLYQPPSSSEEAGIDPPERPDHIALPKRVHRCRLGEVVSLANTRIVLPAQAAESFESDDDEKDLRPGGVSAEAGDRRAHV